METTLNDINIHLLYEKEGKKCFINMLAVLDFCYHVKNISAADITGFFCCCFFLFRK